MKIRVLLALVAVLTTAACDDSSTAPPRGDLVARLQSIDSVAPASDGPLQGSGNRP